MKLQLCVLAILLIAGCTAQLQTYQANQSPLPVQPHFPNPPQQLPPQQPGQIIDDGDTGSLNHGYMQAQPYSKIIIEIDYISGYEPTSSTKSALQDVFQNVARKQVTFAGGNVITPTKNTYTVNDLIAMEKTNRQYYTSGDTAVVYMMFLNGQFQNGGALGVSFKASSMALFVERINDATSALILYSQIEKAVAVHELGHLMGLVNINYRSERNHEDVQHPSHSNNENSVMFWAVEDISLKNVLNFGPPSNFDNDDLFDLQKIRDGTY